MPVFSFVVRSSFDHFLLFLQTLKVKVKVLCDVFEENESPSLNGTVIFFVRCYAITR